MKKTCLGCRALGYRGGNINGFGQNAKSCILGFDIDGRYLRPLENCPKPTTYKQMENAEPKRLFIIGK